MVGVQGSTGGQHILARWVDQSELYGAHIVSSFCRQIDTVKQGVDLGAGHGRDLGILKSIHPSATTWGIECAPSPSLEAVADHLLTLDLERDSLPFEKESVDLVIANQLLEHTKEIFWIFHEISRILTVGGHLIVGVPNIASFHNRILLLLGQHPTQWKSYSAHVRIFSKADTLKLLSVCFPKGYELADFQGSQFYPLPTKLARLACLVMPTGAFSIFFLLKKCRPYCQEFLEHPPRACLETNFYLGS
ncbi:MAG TPA: methyltransferase domain-containing protein [Leptolyngbyaceae cyanobacterium]